MRPSFEEINAVKKRLSVEEACELAQRRRHQWLLLGFAISGPGVFARPTFACPQCWQQHITLATLEAKLPLKCPRCGAALAEPDESLAPGAGLS